MAVKKPMHQDQITHYLIEARKNIGEFGVDEKTMKAETKGRLHLTLYVTHQERQHLKVLAAKRGVTLNTLIHQHLAPAYRATQ